MTSQKETKMKNVYILLLRSQSFFSRVIHTATREEYTHVSLSMLDECTEFYSFARRYTNLPLPAGFVKESIDKGLMARSKTAPCALYRLSVPAKSYHSMKRRLRKMLRKQKLFRYSVIGTFLCFFKVPYKRENKYFCSQFIAELLCEVGAVKLSKMPELFHPVDFEELPELTLCYKGTLGNLYSRKLESC